MKNNIRLDLIRISDRHDFLFEDFVRQTGGISFLLSQANPSLDVENALAHITNRETSKLEFQKSWLSIFGNFFFLKFVLLILFHNLFSI